MPSYEAARHLCILATRLESMEQNHISRLMVFMPPRSGKSELCSIKLPAWYLGRHPQEQIIACSYSEMLAYSNSYAVRETILSPRYQVLWPLQLDQSGAIRWQLAGKQNKRASYIAAGVGGSITGEGADLLIIDDPIKNQEEAESEVYRERVLQWYLTTARTRLQPNGKIIIIQTRWHTLDLAGALLDLSRADPRADQWDVLNFPAINDNGEALWPERYPIEEVNKIRASIGERNFESLYQGAPTIAEGNIFKREWWQYYKEPPVFNGIYHSWDTAFKTKTSNDYSVLTTWGVTNTGYYLIDMMRKRLEMPELKRMAVMMAARDKPRAIFIEDMSSGQSLIQELQRETNLPILPKKVDADKVVRAYAVSPLVEAGKVYLPQDKGWIIDYLEEMSSFPNGEHDDIVDSTTMALRYMANPSPYGFSISGGKQESNEDDWPALEEEE